MEEDGVPAVDIVLVDDHPIWRAGVRSLLRGSEFRVVGEASSGREATALVRERQPDIPDIVLLDVRMGGDDGLDALHQIKKEYPRIAVVLLTAFDNPLYSSRAVIEGASGYLLKGIGRDELLDALRAVARGETRIDVRNLERSLRVVSERAAAADLTDPLTRRELDVLRLVAMGLRNREIASALCLAETTVKKHVEHIIDKLGVADRVQAAVWAARFFHAPNTDPHSPPKNSTPSPGETTEKLDWTPQPGRGR